MGIIFLLLLFDRLDLGVLLCVCVKKRMGQPGISAWTGTPDLWKRGAHRSIVHDFCTGSDRSDLSFRDGGSHTSGICDRGLYGTAVPGALLGLQPSAAECSWLYLPARLFRMGSLFGVSGAGNSCAG